MIKNTDAGFDAQGGNKSTGSDWLSKQLNQVPIIHGALDFKQDGVLVGFQVQVKGTEDLEISNLYVFCDAKGLHAEVNAKAIQMGDNEYYIDPDSIPPLLANRWSIKGIEAFKSSPHTSINLFDEIDCAIRNYADFTNDPLYGLITAWVVATYFSPIFEAFPFLNLYGPKESGKSQALDILKLTSFNPEKVITVTAAALGVIASNRRATVLIDQAEYIPSTLISLLADGYKRSGGGRQIVQYIAGIRTVTEHTTYGPKAFASFEELHFDLQDRCLRIHMQRSKRKIRTLDLGRGF